MSLHIQLGTFVAMDKNNCVICWFSILGGIYFYLNSSLYFIPHQ